MHISIDEPYRVGGLVLPGWIKLAALVAAFYPNSPLYKAVPIPEEGITLYLPRLNVKRRRWLGLTLPATRQDKVAAALEWTQTVTALLREHDIELT